jgi:hypothetical protein
MGTNMGQGQHWKVLHIRTALLVLLPLCVNLLRLKSKQKLASALQLTVTHSTSDCAAARRLTERDLSSRISN